MSLGLLVCGGTIYSGESQAYDKANVHNQTSSRAHVTVHYAACRHDSFTVDAGKSATPSAHRGGCLITKIEASLDDHEGVQAYTSSGTSYSQFIIKAVPERNIGLRIFSDHELNDIMAEPPVGPFHNGQAKRPFYVVGHNPNQIPLSYRASWNTENEVVGDLDAGANALEPDIMKFSDKAAFGGYYINTRPGTAGKSGLFVYHDDVLITTHMPATVEEYFTYIHDLIKGGRKIALLTVDVKSPAYGYGAKLVQAVHDNLNKDGVQPWVIYNCGDNNAAAIQFFKDTAGMLKNWEGISIDGTRDPDTIYDALSKVSTNGNIAFGTGGQGFTSGSFPHVSLAVDQATWRRTAKGLNAAVPYVFPVPGKAEAAGVDWWESFMNAGIDGLIPDLDFNPVAPGTTRKLIKDLKEKVDHSVDYYMGTVADNPFKQGHEGYALRVGTSHNFWGDAGTDGWVTFVLTGTKGSSTAVFNGRTSAGSETRFHDNGTDYLVIPSKNLGKLKSLTMYVSGHEHHSWEARNVQISSALYGIPEGSSKYINIGQTVKTHHPVTINIDGYNLGTP
jgi:hypothetical protein